MTPGYYTWSFLPIPIALLVVTVLLVWWFNNRPPK